MRFYEPSLIPEELKPDWELWMRMPDVSLEELAALALGIDPRRQNYFSSKLQIEDELSCNNTPNVPDPEPYYFGFDDDARISYQSYLVKFKDKIKPFIDQNILDAQQKSKERKKELLDLQSNLKMSINELHFLMESTFVGKSRLTIYEFVDWLDRAEIPFPKEIKECAKLSILMAKSIDFEKEYRVTMQILSATLKIAKEIKGCLTQDFFSKKISEVSNLNKRKIDDVFALSNKQKS